MELPFFATSGVCHIFTMTGTVLHNNIVSDYFIGRPKCHSARNVESQFPAPFSEHW